jgi:hypothetical protein
MQSVRMPHRYAAALMATDVAKCSDFQFPWPVFEVMVPNGLLACDAMGELTSVLVISSEDDVYAFLLFDDGGRGRFAIIASSTNEFLYGVQQDPEESNYLHEALGTNDPEAERDPSSRRLMSLAVRLVANASLDITTTPSRLLKAKRLSPKKPKHGLVTPVGFEIGRPLDLDCRQDIRDYVAGKRSTEPKVTTLVRGHWRNQVHGPGNALRKIIWVQPFYRGHGPMIVRPTRLGFRHDEEIS